ncbi:MAG TPA: hypothetical protein PLV42_01545 [bacterium]|nr:hypothetical protein [bacterium]
MITIKRPKKFVRSNLPGVFIEGLVPGDLTDDQNLDWNALKRERSEKKQKITDSAFLRFENYLKKRLSSDAAWEPLALLEIVRFSNGHVGFIVAIQYDPGKLMDNHYGVEKVGRWPMSLLEFERKYRRRTMSKPKFRK